MDMFGGKVEAITLPISAAYHSCTINHLYTCHFHVPVTLLICPAVTIMVPVLRNHLQMI